MPEPLIVERQTTASTEAVYDYLTTSAKWVEWQGAEAELDPQPGGIFRMTMPDGRTARGQYVDLQPHTKVVFTWGWVDVPGIPPGSSTVTVELIPNDDGTLIRLTHGGLSAEEASMHLKGWEHYVPRLAAVAEGNPPVADPGPNTAVALPYYLV